MRFRFTLSRPATSINSIPSWEDLGNGSASWVGGFTDQSVTLGSFQSSNWLADDITNPYVGTYEFTLTASGTISGGAGNTAQITFHFLDAEENIIESSDAINIPNAGLTDYAVSVESGAITPAFIMVQVNNLTSSSNEVTVAVTYDAPESSKVISEPDGWAGAKIKLERDPEFFSLIEYYEGAANGAFIFYGSNEAEGIDGGIDFIRSAEQDFGFDVNLTILIEYSDDDVTYSTLFSGQLDLSEKNEMTGNKMQVPVIRNDSWAKFINRYETPVNLSDTVDLDGNPVDPVTPISVYMTPQIIRRQFNGHLLDTRTFDEDDLTTDDYIQIDVDDYTLDEIDEKYTLPIITNPEIPAGVMSAEEPGVYSFDLRVEISIVYYDTTGTYPDCSIERTVTGSGSYLDLYIQINDNEPIAFTEETSPLIFDNVSTIYTYQGDLELNAKDQIKIYADVVGNISNLGDAGATLWIHSKNGVGQIMVPQSVADVPTETCTFLPATEPTNVTIAAPSLEENPTYFNILAKTTRQPFEAQGYLIHDLIDGVLARIGTDPLYSEFLGSTATNTRQYDSDGCGWMYAIIKGLQLRQYTLEEKPFFISMKDIWQGINPILNLGLGYEEVEGSQVIRIEQKSHFIGSTAPIIFSNVHDIESSYDRDFIFKTVKTGYREWQTEDGSGLDDPQTKHTYATRFEKTGKDLDLESGFIAGSLSIEVTARTTREKSNDYKHDNKNFIISLNTDDLSPDVYLPELDENFSSLTGLLDPETRYNSILTPLRNMLRWADYIVGCLQSYLTSKFKFVSGEGNYDMASTATLGSCERAVLDDNLSEDDDIALVEGANARFDYFFLPMLYNITIPMEKEDFDLIDRKKPIGISQTESGHINFHIKELEYELLKGEAVIKAWPRSYFPITVPEQIITTPDCGGADGGNIVFDADYQAVLDYGTAQGYSLPSEDQQIIENQKMLNMKAEGVWDDLDLFYHFETDGDEDFAKINWKNPGTNNLVKNGTVTFTELEGFTGDGSTGYLDTGWAPATNAVHFTQDEGGAFCYINNNPAAAVTMVFGARGNGSGAFNGQMLLVPKINSGGEQHYFAVNAASATPVDTGVSANGFYHIRRVLSNDMRLFKNGSQVGATQTSVSSSLSNRDVAILACNFATGVGNYSDHQIGCFGIGASLTGKESALNTIFNS